VVPSFLCGSSQPLSQLAPWRSDRLSGHQTPLSVPFKGVCQAKRLPGSLEPNKPVALHKIRSANVCRVARHPSSFPLALVARPGSSSLLTTSSRPKTLPACSVTLIQLRFSLPSIPTTPTDRGQRSARSPGPFSSIGFSLCTGSSHSSFRPSLQRSVSLTPSCRSSQFPSPSSSLSASPLSSLLSSSRRSGHPS